MHCCRWFGFQFYLFAISLLACSTSGDLAEAVQPEGGWKKLGPGGGGSTFMPVFSWTDPEHFAVRCDMTGTYFSSDGGDSYYQVNFPNGSSAYAYHPNDANIIYAGSAALQRSSDGGRHWAIIFPDSADIRGSTYTGDHASFRLITSEASLYPTEGGQIENIRLDPANPKLLSFSMQRFFFFSEDEGLTFIRKDLPSRIIGIYTKGSPANEDIFLFASDALFIFNKNTKEVRSAPLPEAMTPAFSFSAGTVKNQDRTLFYALHNEGDTDPDDEFGHTTLWMSEDSGTNWKPVQDDIISNTKAGVKPSYSMISTSEQDASYTYVVCNRYEERKQNGDTIYWYGALRTANGGTTWDWVWKGGGGSGQYGVKDGVGVSNLLDAWTEKAFGGEYIRLLDAGVYPGDGKIAVVTDWYRTMKTTDGGRTWREIYSHAQEDGSYISRGMDVTTNYGVHFDPFDSLHIAISYTDIGYHHSFNGGKSWVRSVNGVPDGWVNTCYWLVFDPEVKGKLWSVWSSLHDFPRGKMTRNPRWKDYARGGVCVSTDGGRTWKPSNEGMGEDSPATSIVLDPNSQPGKRILYATAFNKGIFKSTDDGKTWALKNNGIDANTAAFELTIQEDGTLFVTVSPTPAHPGGKTSGQFYSGAVYRSTDGAESWTKLRVTDGLLFPNGIATDPGNPDRIYLACWSDITLSDLVGGNVLRQAKLENKTLEMPGGIFLSEDGGATWKSIFDENQYVYDVTVDPYHAGRIYCNTFNKVAWRSDDYGKTWTSIADYDFHWGHRVILDENNHDKVYLTTYGSSVWHGEPRAGDRKFQGQNK